MKKLKITFNSYYKGDKIKLLYEECQQQAYDFYEQAQINHFHAESKFKESGTNTNNTFIISKELIRLLMK